MLYPSYPSSCTNTGSHIRFEAKTAGKAMEWVESIRQAISDEQERERQRVSNYTTKLHVCS